LVVDAGLADNCFGFDPNSLAWDTVPPSSPEIAALLTTACPDPIAVGDCVVPDPNASVPTTSEFFVYFCYCVTDPDPAANPLCCEDEVADPGSDVLNDMMSALENCGYFSPTNWTYEFDCPLPVFTEDPYCPDYYYAFAPPTVANYVFLADRELSYINSTTFVWSATTPVFGQMSANTNAQSFVSASLIVDAVTAGAVAVTDWVFVADAAIDYDPQTGWFSVYEPNVELLGGGELDGIPTAARTHMSEPAFGQLHPTTSTWELDYEESGVGWSFAIHLDGTYAQNM
jgi:hypothetical protein